MDFHILLSDAQYPSKPEKRGLDSSASCPTISSIPSNSGRSRHLRSSSQKPAQIHTPKGGPRLGTRIMTSLPQSNEPLFPNSTPQSLSESTSMKRHISTTTTTRKKRKADTSNANDRHRVAAKRYVTRSTNGVASLSSQSSSYSDDEDYEPDTQAMRGSTRSTRTGTRARYQSTVPSQSQSHSHSHLRKSLKLSTTLPLRRVPSIMDIFLDARSPSIDYDEEVFLEIAERSTWALRRCDLRDYQFLDEHSLRVYWADQGRRARIWLSLGGGSSSCTGPNAYAGGCRPLTQLPDSFERSTAGWTDTDVDANPDAGTDTNSDAAECL
ncbi:hypothetical protein VKT23_001788 [Stygiomarasmius scandens]|uniref:Uncharacterized protein n=1 Tax=Marasmiellus scandens TaxID=2682957 RepID=A0ABR1K218_9AGAR